MDDFPGCVDGDNRCSDDSQDKQDEMECGTSVLSDKEDDGNSDDSSSEDESILASEISEVESTLEANPYLYDKHVSLIETLKRSGDLDKLRKARERMSSLFPLTEVLWLDWIRDEMGLSVTEEEKDMVAALFERAVKDYLSVELWLEYAQFSIGRMGTVESGIDKCRALFERAITAAGLHVSKGSVLWEAYREFENAILMTVQHPDENLTSEQEEAISRQYTRVMNVFKRQLSVPLLDMEKTYEELNEWAPQEKIDPNIKLGFNKAVAKLKKITPYEEALFAVEAPTESVYGEYIAFETKEGEPTRIQCLYERAIVENCLSPSLWEQYVDYLDFQLKIASVVLPVYERAIRNCPWSLKLWQGYLRALERYNEPRDKVKETVERALTAGFTSADEFRELWLTYVDYLRRGVDFSQDQTEDLTLLRATFEKAHNYLIEGFGVDGDPTCILFQYWARIEGKFCKNMEKAREIWNDILHLGHSQKAQMWLEFCNLEKCAGDSKHLRKLFARAVQSTSDWPEYVAEAWLTFERDEGTLEQWENASSKIDAKMTIIQNKRLKELELAAVNEPVETVKKGKSMAGHKTVSLSQPSRKTSTKRKFEELGGDDTESNVVVDKEGFKIPRISNPNKDCKTKPLNAPPNPPTAKKREGAVPRVNVERDSSKDERSVFVSNLSFDVDEKRIQEFFEEIGEVKEVRLVRDYKGRSKGFCYVEFADWDIVLKALKKDRVPIDGRPVFVSKCEDKSKRTKQKFKYSVSMERNKLFVKGLPLSATQDVVVETFKPFGELKEARLVTYRNGHSKGYAFVEYKDEASAVAAVETADGMVLDGHTISVAISNPSESKSKTEDKPSLGEWTTESSTGPRGRGRTRVTLLPRSVAVKASSNGSAKGTTVKPMSNDDFRNMLVSK